MEILKKVKENSHAIAFVTDEKRNQLLDILSSALKTREEEILNANNLDIDEAKKEGKPQSFIDRLMLNSERIDVMREGLEKLKSLKSPLGEVFEERSMTSGLNIKKMTVPLGVFAIIYEARPNVTVDTIGLSIKSGNGIVLRGSKDAINSNIALVKVIKESLTQSGQNADFIGLIEDTTHEGVKALLKQRDYIDVVIPRGGEKLIKSTIENSLIPVIETGLGNCHVYVSKHCNFDMAKKVALSSKNSRVSVCNSSESLVIDKNLGKDKIAELLNHFIDNNIELRGEDDVIALCDKVNLATDKDFYTEYNDYIMSVKLVSNLDEGIDFINRHSTHHSECILTENTMEVEKFFERIDSACVYHNTSTRFSDGFEFGLGAEVGISTQKLHARGPMGIKELTTYKYIIDSNYCIR